ncbi:MAG TPA: RNB domain-containing ribonuclease [Solirubrobacteraceae bacterium]|nr:RNB domain-containing ribonuclease [Solirubrobacteraceae bacterium]
MTARERRGGGTVAVLDKRGRFLVATPFFTRGGHVTVDRDKRAGPGDLVLLRERGQGRGHAKVARRIGRPDVARDVLEALMLDRGLTRGFPDAVERAAAETTPPDVARRDLRSLTTFTIDPAGARDFDDAISAEALADDHWRVWVHIADVSAYVRPGSPVDREAHRRATSVYVPGTVEPMLPHALSSDACSLRPGEDRLAVTVEMELRGPKVEKASFQRSLIRSDARLDYDRVDRVFAAHEPALEPWGEPLAVAREVAAALDRARAQRGALAVESSEPEFEFDEAGQVVEARPVAQTESHRLIEHLMIAANEQVATLLESRGVATLYRVHERPEPEAVKRLVEQLASLDVATPPIPETITPQQAADLVGELSRAVDAHVRRTGRGRRALTSLVLRSLKQAHYSPRNLGHAGLGSPRYLHFTSPIRRYPDLVAHRALLSAVGGGEDAPRASGLEEAGAWTSTREREAMTLERDADDVARCFLLQRELLEVGHNAVWDGEVVGLAPVGAFVAFGDERHAYEGLLPVRRLEGDWWELDELGTILRGTRTGETLRLGDPVKVEIGRVDSPRGRVDLHPVAV